MKIFMTLGIAAVLAFGSSSAFAQSKANKDSANFVKTAIQHNFAEIDAGKLAQEKGNSPAVKEYGAMLVKDHSEANGKAETVARQMNVEPPTSADVTHKASYLKLKVLSGDTFDRTFMNDMVKDHEADVKKFQQQATKNDAAGNMAKEILPKLQTHLAEAKKVQQQLKQTTGSR